jgi:hypothetical protein
LAKQEAISDTLFSFKINRILHADLDIVFEFFHSVSTIQRNVLFWVYLLIDLEDQIAKFNKNILLLTVDE